MDIFSRLLSSAFLDAVRSRERQDCWIMLGRLAPLPSLAAVSGRRAPKSMIAPIGTTISVRTRFKKAHLPPQFLQRKKPLLKRPGYVPTLMQYLANVEGKFGRTTPLIKVCWPNYSYTNNFGIRATANLRLQLLKWVFGVSYFEWIHKNIDSLPALYPGFSGHHSYEWYTLFMHFLIETSDRIFPGSPHTTQHSLAGFKSNVSLW